MPACFAFHGASDVVEKGSGEVGLAPAGEIQKKVDAGADRRRWEVVSASQVACFFLKQLGAVKIEDIEMVSGLHRDSARQGRLDAGPFSDPTCFHESLTGLAI